MVQNTTGNLTLYSIMGDPDDVASMVANQFTEWQSFQTKWMTDRKEILEYIFATDTSGTANSDLPWKNSTHIPKICQVRDNLHANYMAALFSTDRPYKWEGSDDGSQTADKRAIIESYMHNKLRMGKYTTTVSQLVLDYIDYGNCFATVESVYEQRENPETGQMETAYVGPKLVRISPNDIVFNVAASDFSSSGKIIRSLNTIGSLRKYIDSRPDKAYLEPIFKKMMDTRGAFKGYNQGDFVKDTSFSIPGFTSWYNYFNSDYVEILEFYGDIYNYQTGKIETNRAVTVVDRHYVLRNEPQPGWHHDTPIYHTGWRIRPDNLMAMGPLDNLVGLQYRIDHLENAKADAFDLIIHPIQKVTGYVEEYNYTPGERIYVGDEGDVEFMRPDVTMLNADTQIALYEQKMEEMAGAPRQAAGFRTPGEKTKYEVQVLENGANRVFINKTAHFEETFLEPLLNAMLISARENMNVSDLIRVADDDTGAVEFLNITEADLKASGKLYPIGSRHFQRDANMLQNITQLASSPLLQDPGIKNHWSGYKTAKLLEQVVGVERFNLVQKNIGITEALESEQQMQAAQQVVAEENSARNPENLNPEGDANGTQQPVV